MSTLPIVSFDGVSVHLGLSPVLREVTLSIAPGEVIGLFGGNGAGKTTLLRLMSTLLQPSAGTATIFGVDITTDDRIDIRRQIGFIGHTPALYPELSLVENLEFVCAVTGADPRRIDDVLAEVGLAGVAGRRGSECSYGMQRRTEFAREILLEPDLLLLDEPHSALDAAASDLVEYLTGRVVGRGGAAVLVSHDRERVEKIATRTLELRAGTVTEGHSSIG